VTKFDIDLWGKLSPPPEKVANPYRERKLATFPLARANEVHNFFYLWTN
jgi:hypothetical protein